MEKERIQPARNSRTLQLRNAGSANIMDNRPDGSRNYLSGHPLQRVEDDEEEDVLQGKLSTPAQRVESEEEDEVGAFGDKEIIQEKRNQNVQPSQQTVLQLLKSGVVIKAGKKFKIDCKKVPDVARAAFLSALNGGFVRSSAGSAGIKRLKGRGEFYELKIYGRDTGNSRLEGEWIGDVFVFNRFIRKAHKGRKSR